MKEMLIKGKTLRYVDEGQGFPILLGHSFLFDHAMWQPQIQELKKTYRVIATDLWGHGQSDTAPEENSTVYDIADDMWRLMQGLGIPKFAVLGLSIGGMWGAKLALEHPENVCALGLFGTYLGAEPSARKVEYDGMFDTLKKLGRFEERFAESLLPFFFCPPTFAHHPELPQNLKSSLMATPSKNIPSIIKQGYAIFSRESLLDQFHKIACPTLVVVGKEDVARPPSESREMASLIQRSEYHEVEKAGHIASLEQPGEINALIRDFLKRVL